MNVRGRGERHWVWFVAVAAIVATAGVAVAGPLAAAQAPPDTTTPIGALESEVAALVELGAFEGVIPPSVSAVHRRVRPALEGLNRASLVTWLTAADRDGVHALSGLRPADGLSSEVRLALGALPADAVDRLRAGQPSNVDAIAYDRALNDLRLRDGAAPVADGAPQPPPSPQSQPDGDPAADSAPVVIPGVRPTFIPSTAQRSSPPPPEPAPADVAGRSRVEQVLLVVAVVAVVVAGALLVAGRRRRAALSTLSELSLTDDLTELGNRRRLERDLDVAFGPERRPVGFVMLDIDHFKQFNDTHGHLAGDETLRRVAAILRFSVREGDVVYRYGGEEFCVLLADADPLEARAVAERLRSAVEAHDFPGAEDQPGGRLTISVGMSLIGAVDARSMKQCADEALYEAKRAGRNRVVVHAAEA